MDKQDLKYAYLNYFRNKSAHNEPIDSENLIEIAGDWEKSNEVLRELIKDGFIESSTPEVDKLGLTIIIDNGLSLTSKGIEEIEKTNFNVSSTNSNKKSENKLLNKIKFSSNTSKFACSSATTSVLDDCICKALIAVSTSAISSLM